MSQFYIGIVLDTKWMLVVCVQFSSILKPTPDQFIVQFINQFIDQFIVQFIVQFIDQFIYVNNTKRTTTANDFLSSLSS